jgi:hypothetical protein
MTGWAWAAIFLLLLIVAGGGWLGYSWLRSRPVSDKAVVQTATDAQDQSLVYIQKIEQQDGAIYVTVDPVEWYVGSQADDMARQDGLCQASTTGCVTNGFYLRNATTTTSMLLLNAQAKVEMQTLSQTASGTPRWDQSVSLQTWIDLFSDLILENAEPELHF